MAGWVQSGSGSQSGSVMLLFLLVLLAGVSYLLAHTVSLSSIQRERAADTERALAIAKQALLDFAGDYPDRENKDELAGPGFLPCPDLDNDGESGVGTGEGCNLSLGRLPWRNLRIEDLRDGSGEHLWYSVSPNFQGRGGSDGKTRPLNSEVPGQLMVDGSDDIVAVVIAPGPVVNNQVRPAAAVLEATRYLEGTNADGDMRFTNLISSPQPFNDRLITISRRELVAVMEQRVLGEVKRRLLDYAEQMTASTPKPFPLLARLRDTRATQLTIAGRAQANTVDNDLHDNNTFVTSGVVEGSVVHNLTDGSFGRVVGPVLATHLQVDGWVGGRRNSIQQRNDYAIYTIPQLTGTVDASTGEDFVADQTITSLKSTAGSVVQNMNTGQQGLVLKASLSDRKVVLLPSGNLPAFAAGQSFRVRTAGGVAAAGSNANALQDMTPNLAFNNDGISPLLIQNLTQQTFEYVQSAPNANQVLFDSASPRVGFKDGDRYLISPFLDLPNVARGQGWLPIHQPGEAFPTGFSLAWSNAGLQYKAVSTPVAPSAVQEQAWRRFLLMDGVSPPTNLLNANAGDRRSMCVWWASNIAHCALWLDRYLSGVLTAGSATTVTDSGTDFMRAGVTKGDRIDLAGGAAYGVVSNVTPQTLQLYGVLGSAPLPAGTPYRISIATHELEGVPAAGSNSTLLRLATAPAVVGGINAGDTVLMFTATKEGAAVVQTVLDPQTLQINWVGPALPMPSITKYKVRSGFIDRRLVEVNVQGKAGLSAGAGLRYRSVHSIAGSRQTAPVLTVRDFDASGSALGVAGAAMLPAPAAAVDIKVDNMVMHFGPMSGSADTGGDLQDNQADFLNWGVRKGDWVQKLGTTSVGRVSNVTSATRLELDGLTFNPNDAYRIYVGLPPWFTANGWHRLVYIAESPDVRPPGGTASGSLQVDGIVPANTPRVIAIAAGEPLPQAGGVLQDRTLTTLSQYLENENGNSLDDRYTRVGLPPFNDRVLVVSPP